MNKIMAQVGKLFGKNFNELLEHMVSAAQMELDNSKEAIAEVENELHLFSFTVEQKIKDQKAAYAKLKEKSFEIEEGSKKMDSALRSYKKKKLATSIITGIVTLAATIGGVFVGLPPNPSALVVLVGVAQISTVIIEVAEMMKKVAEMYGINANMDKSAIDNLQFKITRSYEQSLLEASYVKSKLPQFKTMRNIALAQFTKIEEATDYRVHEVTDMKQSIFDASDAGVDFVNEVNIFTPDKH